MLTWILIVFINGMAVPTTQFNNLEACEDLKKVIALHSVSGKAEPVCLRSFISTKKDN